MAQLQYKYYITDNSGIGTLLESNIQPGAFLMIISRLIVTNGIKLSHDTAMSLIDNRHFCLLTNKLSETDVCLYAKDNSCTLCDIFSGTGEANTIYCFNLDKIYGYLMSDECNQICDIISIANRYKNEYLYFITNNTNGGFILDCNINPKSFLLVIGKYMCSGMSFDDVKETLETQLNAKIIEENTCFNRVYGDEKDSYIYSDLIENGYFHQGDCVCCNLDKIKLYFSDADCIEMLKSLNLSNDI